MNRKFLSSVCAVLISAVLFGLTPAAASAAPEESQTVTFSDVGEKHTFYSDITELSALGIINGYPDGTFRPENDITNAEFIKILLCCAPSASETAATALYPDHWASDYITEAYSRGILTDAMMNQTFSPDAPITRGVMTEMAVRALGIYVPEGSESPFTDTEDRYAVAAYEEYILRGYPTDNGKRLCKPDSRATRGEATAIAVRMVNYQTDPYEYKKTAVLENAANYPLTTESEFLDLFYILNREFITEFTFTTPLPYETWLEYNKLANVLYLEYYYSSYMNCTYKKNSNVYTIKLEFPASIETLKNCHTASEAIADAVISMIIKEGMSDFEKVTAIHDYLVLNCAYNYDNYTDNTVTYRSRIAYGALCERTAICQGYCAAFNLLAKRAGIRSAVVTGYAQGSPERHAWNMVYANNAVYYVDVTHDDPVPDRPGSISHKYLLRTEEEMVGLGYIWEPNQTQSRYLY